MDEYELEFDDFPTIGLGQIEISSIDDVVNALDMYSEETELDKLQSHYRRTGGYYDRE